MIDNRDLRLLNVRDEDKTIFKNKIFIETWNRARSSKEAAKKLNMTTKHAQEKASRLRTLKVQLKHFRHPSWESNELSCLIDIAKKTFPANQSHRDNGEAFRIWNSSRTIDEASKKIGMTPKKLAVFMAKWRIRGIPLKYFRFRNDKKELIRKAIKGLEEMK